MSTISISKSLETEQDAVVSFVARVDNKLAGALLVARGIERPFYRVSQIEVHPQFRGQGVGKALYNAAAAHACKKKRILVSDTQRSEWAEAFWRTQAKRGRARCMERNKRVLPYQDYNQNVFDSPRLELLEELARQCEKEGAKRPMRCAERLLKEQMRRLPRPRPFMSFGRYRALRWPCVRWASKKDSCKRPTVFEGFQLRKV